MSLKNNGSPSKVNDIDLGPAVGATIEPDKVDDLDKKSVDSDESHQGNADDDKKPPTEEELKKEK
jgi:hypothetical protein